MSCRRKDRPLLRGCNVGIVAIRGCSTECCPVDPDRMFEYSHVSISDNAMYDPPEAYDPTDEEKAEQARTGRTDLRWRWCDAGSYKPKFICPKPSCRRLFKAFYDDTMLEHDISRAGWRVRPNPAFEANEDVRKSIKRGQGRRTRQRVGKYADLIVRHYANTATDCPYDLMDYLPNADVELLESIRNGTAVKHPVLTPLDGEELRQLMIFDSEMWWTDIVGVGGDNHRKRCSTCGGKGIRVGSNFRVPSKTDDKAWKEVEDMIERGDDMQASFEYCMKAEDYNDAMIEARRRIASKKDEGEAWKKEKARRFQALGLTLPDASMIEASNSS